MLSIVSLVVIVTLSILVTRIATVALMHTGLSKESARFQARSAFTGVGFTTDESEAVVRHPVRRRVLLVLMLLGNAGFVSAASSLILTFVGNGGTGLTVKIVVLVAALVALWGLASSRWVDRYLSRLISRVLERATRLEVRDYASLLHLQRDYRVTEVEVEADDWLTGKTLEETALRDEGVVVLGIRRADRSYIGAPKGTTTIEPHDVLVLYGRAESLEELDERKRGRAGDRAHEEAVGKQHVVEAGESDA